MQPESGPIFWLTLVATLAAGWAITIWRFAIRGRRRSRRREQYLEGVRFLLDDQSDRALEVFLGLAEIDDATVETHFALGSLYRRRGEVDRAIKVHQHIFNRSELHPRHRTEAQTELARDYFRAGLYDRAEKIFKELADRAQEPGVALTHLVRLYEMQHDWLLAAQTHEKLSALGAPEQPLAVSHYYCELAEAAIAARDFDVARAHLRNAHRGQPEFGRGLILQGDLAHLQDDPRLAVQLYRRVVLRDFHLLPLVLPRLAEAAGQAGEPQAFDAAIAELIQQGSGNQAEIAYAAIVSGYFDDPLILECVRAMLAIDSDLRDMAAAFLPEGVEGLSNERVRAIAGALRNVVLRHARYRCSECGIDSSSFLWHCPGCHGWETLRAIAALEFLPRAARPRSPRR